MPSKALEINLATSRVDVTVEDRFGILKEVMEKYPGVHTGLHTFLEEICHPLRNWEFIVNEARGYALNYFHVLKSHPRGPEAAKLYIDIFLEAMDASPGRDIVADAADNLLFFIQKIMKEAGTRLHGFSAVMDYAFDRIGSYRDETFFLFVKSFYQLSGLGKGLSQLLPPNADVNGITALLIKYYGHTYRYWLDQADPLELFQDETMAALKANELDETLRIISHKGLHGYQEELEDIVQFSERDPESALIRLVALPGFGRIVAIYKDIPHRLLPSRDEKGKLHEWRLIFLLHVMDISGLSSIHEETLREINRTLGWLIEHQGPHAVRRSLEKTFAILERSAKKFPGTALHCVLNMGRGVYRTDESDLVDFFIDSLVSLGFQPPKLKGVGDDWQVRVNPGHIQNIRTWLQLIELKPMWSKKLLSSLIIHLSLSGVFIRDTDLFPREITRLLNSDISPVFNLTKQLTRLFPAYFNSIGAEGRLRDVSTHIDELCSRKDVLIHFLRKQSHVESSNQIVGLIEAALNFWKTKAKEGVRPFVPPGIYREIEREGPYIDGVHGVITKLFRKNGLKDIQDLLQVDEDNMHTFVGHVPGASDIDFERVGLAISFYKLLHQKYRLGFTEIEAYLSGFQSSGLPDLDGLRNILAKKDTGQKLSGLLDYLDQLKGIVLSSEDFEIREDIYRKRHFAADIPSMYGSYHEMKFDALGLMFRLESLAHVLFEELIDAIDLNLITRATFFQIRDNLRLFNRALHLDGITSLEMERQLDLLTRSLKIRGFTSTQYLDIFRGFSRALGNIVNDFFNNTHQENLLKISKQVQREDFLPKYLLPAGDGDREKLAHRVTEIFLRDQISSSFGLQQLDLFLTRILNTMNRQAKELHGERLHLLLSYDPQKAITPLKPAKKLVYDIIHLGNKGLNLVKILGHGLPVPPGFIITTEVFRCRDIVDHYPAAGKNYRERVATALAALEKRARKSFGSPRNPLLLSVRSGSAISQPGMMYSLLDVGINEEIVRGMIARTKNAWFGWDTYRRFLQSYGMAFGLQRDDFDAIIEDAKTRYGVPYKKDLTGKQMNEVALAYKSFLKESGIEIKESPFEQLLVAIRKVLESWYAPKAETYRKIMGISHDWGTAVTVQAMVFGNSSPFSGAGVFFTHNPRWRDDTVLLWGDFTPGNQGEDVVSGLVRTLPVSRRQAEVEDRDKDSTLETLFPDIYQSLRDWAKKLIYDRNWSPQEMEFTFEGPEKKALYFLQTRDMTIRERKKVYSFDVTPDRADAFLGRGIGVSGGAMSGRVVFSLEEIEYWGKAEPDTHLILIRSDTVPDDIMEIYKANGLLTARGGSTSHAAIVAHGLDKTCVVGFPDLICMEKDSACSLSHRSLKSGDRISIDGMDGSVYLGAMQIRETESL